MAVPSLARVAALEEVVRRHARAGLPACLASATFALPVLAMLWNAAHAAALAAWTLCLAAALLLRVAVGRPSVAPADGTAAAPAEQAARALRRFRFADLCHGIGWAGVTLAALPFDDPQRVLMLTTALFVVAAGAFVFTPHDPLAALAFSAPPIAGAMFAMQADSSGQWPVVLLAAGGLAGVAVFAIGRGRAEVAESVAARLAADARVADLRRLADEADVARRELADKHHLMSALLRTTQQGFWLVDHEGVTLDLNPAMCHLLGRERAAVIGRRATEFFEGEALDVLRRELAARREGVSGAYEVDIRRPDGRVMHCLNHATPVMDASGRRIGSVGLWTDITTLHDHERALAVYALATNSFADPVSVVDEQQIYRMVNDAWCRITGIAREAALGRHAEVVLPDAYSAVRRAAFTEALRLNRPQTVSESTVGLPQLAGRLYETTYCPYTDDRGRRHVAIVNRDITLQEQQRAAIAETAAYLERTLNATGDAIFASDAVGLDEPVRFSNQQLMRLWRMPADEPLPLTPRRIIEHARAFFSDPAAEMAEIQRLIDGNLSDERELHLNDGRVIVRRCIPALLGQRTVRVWSFRDVTAERRTLDLARASEAEQRSLLEAFPGYIARVDSRRRYTYVNSALARLCGRPPEALIGVEVAALLGPAGVPLRQATERAFLEGSATLEFRHPADDGMQLQITLARGAHPGSSEPGLYAFGVDITARKRAEEALIAARDEAERANLAKSQFMSQMSHELRTPMNAILGLGQLLVSDPQRPLLPVQRSYVDQMLRGARHLLELINEVLDLGRIETGQLTVERRPVPLAELLEECMNLVRPLAAEHDVQVQLLPGGTPAVAADPLRLKQVLLNLLGNAIKYNRRPGSVTLGAATEAGTVRVIVRDTGRGLSAEQQRRLFQPFERLGAEQAGIEGTGIGLALSRRLVEAMQGSIGVHSEPGIGSTFWVRLPRAAEVPALPAPAAAPPVPPPAPAVAGDPTVLYVEDNPVNRFVMEAIFERLPDYRLVCAATPGEGLAQALALRPALILLDVQLPGMDGAEVLAHLKADPATADIPVVAVSANAMADDIATMLAAGARAYVTKPVELDRLAALVRQYAVAP